MFGSHQIAISDVSVADKEYGIQVGSSVSTWNGLAPQHVTISNVSISNCIDGLRIVTDSIDGDDPQGYWDFTNTSISNVDIVNCTNWSVIIDSNNNNTSKLKGIHLRDITAVAGSGGGGAGGMFFPSLVNSSLENISLVSDHAADITIQGAMTQRSGTVESLPESELTIDNMTINSPGRFLIQDISGIQCGRIASYNANAEAIYLNRVKNTSVQDVKSYMPLRGSGAGRGLLMTQCFNLDIGNVHVITDNHVGTYWASVELGGGDATYPAGKGVRVRNLSYTSTRNASTSDVGIQGGPYAPVQYLINASWRHSGATSPTWISTTYGNSDITDLDGRLDTAESSITALNTAVAGKAKGTIVTGQGYSPGAAEYRQLATLPIDDSNNYCSLILSGRIGGWAEGNQAAWSVLLTNRSDYSGNNVGSAVLGLGAVDIALLSTDIVVYKQADKSAIVYIKSPIDSFWTYDFNASAVQAVVGYSSTPVTPTGSQIWSLSGANKFTQDSVGVAKVNGNIVGSWIAVPSTATSTGKTGQMASDSSFLYVCTATDTWRRVAVASW